MEEQIITNKLNAHIDPVLDVWQWQVPVYLFLGGLAAGLLILGAIGVLRKRSGAAQRWLPAVPVVLAVGMLALFLDLEHKLYVWRFYTAFRITSPMSWGAWILILVIPVNVLLVLGTLRANWPSWSRRADAQPWLRPVISFAETHADVLAKWTIGMGVALGIYTGILLSAYVARPFWNTSILGLVFLASGVSSAAALVQASSREHAEQHRYARLDMRLIMVELLLIGLMVVSMVYGAEPQRRAADLILGGALTMYFWIFVVMIGLLLPFFLESVHLRGKSLPRFLAPAFVLAGGLIFRFFIVEAGQLTSWIGY